MTKIAIILYTLCDSHIVSFADSVKKGVEASGAECTIFQVPETRPRYALSAIGAPAKSHHPIMTAAKMPEFDGFIFGLSGPYGIMPSQMKSFMDSTGGLWQMGRLKGKSAGCFFSTPTQGGGQETMGLTAVTFFAYQGMVFVPMGYIDPKALSYDEPHGASPYGSGTFSGLDGERPPTQLEKDLAVSHGKHFGLIAAKLAN